jgi:hypothetical protein
MDEDELLERLQAYADDQQTRAEDQLAAYAAKLSQTLGDKLRRRADVLFEKFVSAGED